MAVFYCRNMLFVYSELHNNCIWDNFMVYKYISVFYTAIKSRIINFCGLKDNIKNLGGKSNVICIYGTKLFR